MQMNSHPILNMHDHAMTTHWMHAVRPHANQIFTFPEHDNLLQFAIANDVWFTPDYDGDTIIQNDRYEQFRLAYMYDQLSNIMDITINLDDDPTDSFAALERLNANDPDENGNQSWIMTPHPYSIVMKTLRLK
jgi:hypothetical protein